MKLTGKERFTQNGIALDLSMLDFWQFKFSNKYNLQDVIAEYLVAKALGKNEAENDAYWTLYDISYKGMRIEVKQTSYYHPWNENGKISNQRTFYITKANSSYEDDTVENKYERQNDIYVFCLNNGKTKETADPLNLDNWEFYIVPTSFINENCGDNKSISLGRIQSFGFEAKKFYEIKETIDILIDGMKEPDEREDMRELKAVLESVSDQYYDFVHGFMDYLSDDEELRNKVIDFIKNNPSAKTDDIIDYYDTV